MTIKEFMEEKNISQRELAKELGIGKSTVGYFASGKYMPSHDVIRKINEKYGVNINGKPKMKIVIQSPFGGDITVQELQEKVKEAVGTVDEIYVRVDHNKAYWVRDDDTGSIDIW